MNVLEPAAANQGVHTRVAVDGVVEIVRQMRGEVLGAHQNQRLHVGGSVKLTSANTALLPPSAGRDHLVAAVVDNEGVVAAAADERIQRRCCCR